MSSCHTSPSCSFDCILRRNETWLSAQTEFPYFPDTYGLAAHYVLLNLEHLRGPSELVDHLMIRSVSNYMISIYAVVSQTRAGTSD